MVDWSFVVVAIFVYACGVVTGMALYRVLWHVDTRGLRTEIDKLSNYNRALQDEIYLLRQTQDELRHRLQMLEDSNQELVRERRAYASR